MWAFIAARQHAAINAHIHDAGVGIFRDAARIGDDVAPAVEPVPIRHRKFIKVDVLAGDLVLLDRTVVNDAGSDAPVEDSAADLHQLARVGIGRKSQHHGDAAITGEAAAEDAAAAAPRLVVVLYVCEKQRGPGAGALGKPHDRAERSEEHTSEL